MSNKELKPCPECGYYGTYAKVGTKKDSQTGTILYYIVCSQCGFSERKFHLTEKAAVTAWNAIERP